MDIIQCNLLVKTKRKWKSRWVVLRRVTPGSERINVYVYKNRLNAISKQKEKFLLSLKDFCCTESVDKENKLPKLVIVTESQPLSLRFEKKEDRDHWVDAIVREGGFGEDITYDGILPSKQPLKSGEVTLHIYPNFFTLVRKQNARCIGRWKFEQLFNYGPVEGGFVFRVESEEEKSTEPESFLLVTSLEKQINRTFDTVYKTAHHMYGSVEGLQRPAKMNSPKGPRPRSMSEPSGFKRFMQRLSIRRKSRRPKSPKWQEKPSPRPEIESSSSASSPEKNTHFGEGGIQHGAAENCAPKDSRNHLSPGSPDGGISQASATSSASISPGISPSPSDGLLSGHVPVDHCDSSATSDARKSLEAQLNGLHQAELDSKDEAAHSGKNECEVDAVERNRDCEGKKENYLKDSLSAPVAENDDSDPTVWQRRSALFLNTDDMIREGLMKAKESDRHSTQPPARNTQNTEGNNNSALASPEERSFEGTGIQARRNTSGNRGKRPMLTIAITPSGSEPSLNQYVNVPDKPKVKQIARLQPGQWDRYDSEENVYHHLDKVIGQPGYQNVPGSEKNVSSTSLHDNSYQNVSGRLPDARSYENVAGARNDIHYINVEAKQSQPVNYIKVSGSGPPTPIQKNLGHSFSSRKANPDYTEIDFVKTKRLGEMKIERDESREANKKERVERVKKT